MFLPPAPSSDVLREGDTGNRGGGASSQKKAPARDLGTGREALPNPNSVPDSLCDLNTQLLNNTTQHNNTKLLNVSGPVSSLCMGITPHSL